MFKVETYEGYMNMPTLKFEGDASIFGDLDKKFLQLKYRTFPDKFNPLRNKYEGLIIADNLDDIVHFFAIDSNNPRGFGGAKFDIILNNCQTTIVGPWSARAGLFNDVWGSLQIAECTVNHQVYHFKLAYLRKLLQQVNSNIGFYETRQFKEETYYVPCEDTKDAHSRLAVKFNQGHNNDKLITYFVPYTKERV